VDPLVAKENGEQDTIMNYTGYLTSCTQKSDEREILRWLGKLFWTDGLYPCRKLAFSRPEEISIAAGPSTS
jgi:hypothetical protein